LHLGAIAMCFGDHHAAREHFEQAERQPSGPYVQYLARFLSARISESEGRTGEAEDLYIQALEIVPRASSATSALAALFLLSGRQQKAATLVEEELVNPALGPDPWVEFQQGGPDRWPTLISRLREASR
jgi:tetratricopeptide (TPR) repeat protein